MPYIGRELDSGNYLKLDDISSSFNGSTTTFNLTAAGKAFFPGSAFSILVNLAGVAQEPESAYQINNATITFATAPVAGDQFFCIVLGVAHGINVPGNGTVNGAQIAKPFNYDGYFYLDDANNRVGVGTATPQKPLHVVGEGQFDSVRVLGDLTVDGTTTTLDTVVTEVDRLEVGANNNTVGLAVTQSGSGDAAIFMGGKVGVGVASPTVPLTVSSSTDHSDIAIFHAGGGTPNRGLKISTFSNTNANAGVEFDAQMGTGAFKFSTGGTERLRITSDGNITFGDQSGGATTSSAIKYIDGGSDFWNSTAGDYRALRYRVYYGSTDAAYGLGVSNTLLEIQSQQNIGFFAGTAGSGTGRRVERLRITSAGSVGIGTNSPQSQFEVYGTSPIVRSKHSTSQKYTQINHNGTDGYVDWSSGGLIFRGASNTERLRIDSSGRIGIGGNGVGSGLGVYLRRPSPNTTHFYEASDGTKTMITGVDSTNDYVKIGSLSNHRLGLVANNGEKLSILPSGNIGINETNPQNSLHISGATPAIRFSDTGANGSAFSMIEDNNGLLKVRNDAGNSGTGSGITFEVDGSEKLRIASDGVITINTVPATNNNANQAVLFQTAAGAIHGGSGLLYNPAEDSLKVNGNTINSNIFLGAGAGPLILAVANYSSTQYIKVSNKIEMKGNVGINTAAPNATLTVGPVNSPTFNRGAVAIKAVQDDNSLPANIYLEELSGAEGYTLSIDSNGDLNFHNSGAAAPTVTFGDANKVGINEANPAVSLDLSSNTDAVSLPTGTTAQRPSGTDAYIRKNSTNNALEFYNGTNWVEIITDYFPTGSTTLG